MGESRKRKQEDVVVTPDHVKELATRGDLAKRFMGQASAKAYKEINIPMTHGRWHALKSKMFGQAANVGGSWYWSGPGTDQDIESTKNSFGIQTFTSAAGLYKDGVYSSPLFEGKGGKTLQIYLKDGVAKVMGGEKLSFGEKMEALFDFLAVAKGTRQFEYDFNSTEFVDMEKVKKVLEIAEKKGYMVQLGPNIQSFLLSNRKSWPDIKYPDEPNHKLNKIDGEAAKVRRKEIDDEVKRVNGTAAKKQKDLGIKDKIDHYCYQFYTDTIKNEKKLPNNAETRQVADAAYEDPTRKKKAVSDDEKLDVAIEQLNDIDSRLVQLASAQSALKTDMDMLETELAKAVATPATMNAAEKAEVLKSYNVAMKERDALMKEMEKEHEDLIQRRTHWRAEVGTLKNGARAADNDSEDVKKEKAERHKKAEKAEKLVEKTKTRSEELGEGKGNNLTGHPETSIAKLKGKMTDLHADARAGGPAANPEDPPIARFPGGSYTQLKNDPEVQKATKVARLGK